jgi:uncharacterized protein involved in response to NO
MYLIFTAFSVAQRMVPFFSHSFAPKNERFVPIIFASLLFISVTNTLEWKIPLALALVALSGYMAWEIKRWQLHPFSSPAILWVLHVALFWLPVAFFLHGVSTCIEFWYGISFYGLGYHLLLLGFLTTILIGFGTRVILGHSGSVPHADKLSTTIFLLIQLLVIVRMLYSFNLAFGWEKNFLFDIAFSLWLVVFGVWGGRFAKVLLFGKRD